MSERALVDSSAWADYLRGRGRSGGEVLRLVAEDRVWLHPIVVGEVLLGGVDLADGRLGALPVLPERPQAEVVAWIRTRDPEWIRGVGWADCAVAHAAVVHGVSLVTSDARQGLLWSRSRSAPGVSPGPRRAGT
jgi:predicted nucleic acid-binding protein